MAYWKARSPFHYHEILICLSNSYASVAGENIYCEPKLWCRCYHFEKSQRRKWPLLGLFFLCNNNPTTSLVFNNFVVMPIEKLFLWFYLEMLWITHGIRAFESFRINFWRTMVGLYSTAKFGITLCAKINFNPRHVLWIY